MKTVRYTAASLLLLTGILHTVPVLRPDPAPYAIPILVFGILYSLTGMLLLSGYRLAPLFGMIFPLIGLATGFLVIGLASWTTLLVFLFGLDAAIITCCAWLFYFREMRG